MRCGTHTRRLLRGLPGVAAVAVTALLAASAAPAASCTAAQKANAVKALRTFQRTLTAQRRAYFRTHRSAKARKAFVRRQTAKLRKLKLAASCSVQTSPPPGPSNQLKKGALAAGEYVTVTFQPRLRFTLGEGWSSSSGDDAILVELVRSGAAKPHEISFTNFFAAASVADTIRSFTSSSDVSVVAAPTPATLAGFSGQRVDIVAKRRILLWVDTTNTYGAGYELQPGQRLRVYVLDVSGKTIVVGLEAPQEEFDAFATDADAVLASLAITP